MTRRGIAYGREAMGELVTGCYEGASGRPYAEARHEPTGMPRVRSAARGLEF